MRVLIVGVRGQLAQALVEALVAADPIPLASAECDLADVESVRRAVRRTAPDLIVNPAALTDVDGCERDPAAAYRVNALGPRWLAQAAEEQRAGLVQVSTDYVFPGDGGAPYDEWAPVKPLSVYGRSKAAGETEALRNARRCWVVRTSWLYGRESKFVNAIRRGLATRPALDVVADEIGGPTYAPDLAAAIQQLVAHDAPGVYHLANSGECSRLEWARAIAELIGSPTPVRATTRAAYRAANPGAPRPAHATLANNAAAALGVELRPWREALAEYLCASR
jgi:dTDP-4-dehydrorhamnose reductase